MLIFAFRAAAASWSVQPGLFIAFFHAEAIDFPHISVASVYNLSLACGAHAMRSRHVFVRNCAEKIDIQLSWDGKSQEPYRWRCRNRAGVGPFPCTYLRTLTRSRGRILAPAKDLHKYTKSRFTRTESNTITLIANEGYLSRRTRHML